MAFGNASPTQEDRPFSLRCNTLKTYKMSLSYFMPRRKELDETRLEGNPTRSRQVNKLLKNITKFET